MRIAAATTLARAGAADLAEPHRPEPGRQREPARARAFIRAATQTGDLQNRAQNVNRDNALRGAGDGNAARAGHAARRGEPQPLASEPARGGGTRRQSAAAGDGDTRGGGFGAHGGGVQRRRSAASWRRWRWRQTGRWRRWRASLRPQPLNNSRGDSDDPLIPTRRACAPQRSDTRASPSARPAHPAGAPVLLPARPPPMHKPSIRTRRRRRQRVRRRARQQRRVALKHVLGNDFHRFIPTAGHRRGRHLRVPRRMVEGPSDRRGSGAAAKAAPTAHLRSATAAGPCRFRSCRRRKGWRFDPPAAPTRC